MTHEPRICCMHSVEGGRSWQPLAGHLPGAANLEERFARSARTKKAIRDRLGRSSHAL